jgi:hypothetical protein
LSDAGEEIGVQWDSTPVIYKILRRPVTQSGEKYYTVFSLNLVCP